MTVNLDGKNYYRTAEVCQRVGISRTTLFRWLKEGVLGKATHRDRRGWRLFTEEEVDILKTEANRITHIYLPIDLKEQEPELAFSSKK
jgi:excisionase family DNA binding protein